MKIDSIVNGYVIDHIPAGFGMKLYQVLELENLSCPVAMITNVNSKRLGKKDLIKISELIDINMDIIGYLTPGATFITIKNGEVESKKTISLPDTIVDVLKCKNPRCITSTEQGIKNIFKLVNEDGREYRCLYCESKFE